MFVCQSARAACICFSYSRIDSSILEIPTKHNIFDLSSAAAWNKWTWNWSKRPLSCLVYFYSTERLSIYELYIGSSIIACLWLGWIVCFVSWDEHRGDSLSIRKVIAATETEEEGQCDMENNPSLFVFSWDQKGLRDLWWIDLFGKVFEE